MTYRRAARNFAAVAGAPLLLLSIAACGASVANGGGPGSGGAIEATVRTGDDVYDAGDPIEMRLVAHNYADSPAALSFTSSQRYDFQIEDAGGETVWTWSADRSFAQVLGSVTIRPGDQLRWEETADVDLEPGTYTVVGTVTNRNGGLTDETTITVR